LANQSCDGKTIITENEKSEVLLQAFFNGDSQYRLLLNTQFVIVAFNDSAAKFHQEHAQLELQTGKSIFDYINLSLISDYKMLCSQVLRGEAVQYEHYVNGCWFYFIISALYNDGGIIEGLCIVGNSINNEKKNEKIIKQQSEYLSNIAWFQSHQLRHPVSSILALINLIKEENNYQRTKEYIEKLEAAALQLDNIIKKIVYQSREI
jgi:signal transduction histidine kinase